MSSLLNELQEWLAENRNAFPFPVRLRNWKRKVLIEIEGLNPLITIMVSHRDLQVSVDWEGENIDRLLWLDIAPVRTKGGYFCELCNPEERKFFRTIVEMRREELYDLFLAWCQERLFIAKFLRIYRRKGYSEARLISG